MPEPPNPSTDSPPYRGSRPYYGSGYTGIGFRGIGGDLLKSFPRITPAPVEPAAPHIAVHGSQLIASMLPGPDGYRVAPCPVCLAHAVVPQLASGWAPLRCASCGTEFVASDGSAPPPVAKPRTHPLPSGSVGESRLLALILLADGGERLARCPVCNSLEVVPGSGDRVDMRCQLCGMEFTAVVALPPRPVRSPPPPPPVRPAKPPVTPPLVVTEAVRIADDGNPFVLCPLCSRFNVNVPKASFPSVVVKCPGCRKSFVVRLPRTPKAPKKAPSPPPPTKPRKAFRGTRLARVGDRFFKALTLVVVLIFLWLAIWAVLWALRNPQLGG